VSDITTQNIDTIRNALRIRNLLMEDWDPLGVNEYIAAQDEYDGYVIEIYSMLLNGELTREKLRAYLLKTAVVTMSSSVSEENLEKTTRKISELLNLSQGARP
jgi:hypothetical protein